MTARQYERPSDAAMIEGFHDTYAFDVNYALSWKRNGRPAGHMDGHGYKSIRLMGQRFKLHRIVWLIVYGHYPSGNIDHIDGDRMNNHPDNLRIATIAQNVHNRIKLGTFQTGVHKGERGRFVARIQGTGGKKVYLGTYDTEAEAAAAYAGASIIMYGEFAPKLSRAA